jgi:Tol biopolymer transport system component
VPTDGSAKSIKLNGALAEGGNVSSFRISPNGNWVVYLADQETKAVPELFSAPINSAGKSAKINGALVKDGSVTEFFAISPDSRRVAYLAAQETKSLNELYAAPITGGGSSSKINGAIVEGGQVADTFAISPVTQRVVYSANQQLKDVMDLYAADILGGSTTLSPQVYMPLVQR